MVWGFNFEILAGEKQEQQGEQEYIFETTFQ
jgi:hypothetical protein